MESILTRKGVNVTKSFSPNQLELLADYTVSGSAITSYTFSGLKLNADEEVVLVSDVVNPTASLSVISLYFNGNTTATNYYRQALYADNTTVGGVRANNAEIETVTNGTRSFISSYLKLTNNGYMTFQSSVMRQYGTSSMLMLEFKGTSTFTLSQITSLTITASVASGIGIGSRFQLYKVKGQVQQTWATT